MADLERIFNKIDKMDERLSNIDTSLVRNTLSLEEHVRRSAAAEESIEILKKELKPIQQHVIIVKFLMKCAIFLLPLIVGFFSYKDIIK